MAAMHKPPPAFAEARRANPVLRSATNPLGPAAETRQLTQIADIRRSGPISTRARSLLS